MKSSTKFVVKDVSSTCDGVIGSDGKIRNVTTHINLYCPENTKNPKDGDVTGVSDLTIYYLGHPRHKVGDVLYVTVSDAP